MEYNYDTRIASWVNNSIDLPGTGAMAATDQLVTCPVSYEGSNIRGKDADGDASAIVTLTTAMEERDLLRHFIGWLHKSTDLRMQERTTSTVRHDWKYSCHSIRKLF